MPSTQEVRFFSATGTPLLVAQRLLLPASWSITGKGGMESFTLPTGATWSELASIVMGSRADIYVDGLLRFRGWVAQRERTKGRNGQPDGLTLTGFGLWRRISRLPCDRQYLYPGGVDLSRAIADLVQDFVAPAFPSLVLELPAIGYSVTSLEATLTTVGDVFAELARWLTGKLVFGCDVDGNGADRLFARPIDTAPSLYLPLPSAKVAEYGAATLTEEQATRIRLIGGQSRYPNLLKNGGFEVVRFASAGNDADSLLTDPGFEARTGWTLGGGASYKSGGLSEGPTYAGDDMLETDTSGESFGQGAASDARIVPGNTLIFGAYVRREVGGTASTGRIRLYWRDGSGAETLGYEEISVAPSSVAWELYNAAVLVPAGAAGWRFFAEQTSGSLLWDECILTDGSLSRPVGWTAESFGSAAIRTVVVDQSPYEGSRCLRVVATASDTDGQDCRITSDEFGLLSRQKVRAKVRLKNRGGGSSPKMRLQLAVWSRYGHYEYHTVDIAAGAVGSSWSTHSWEWQIPLAPPLSIPYERGRIYLTMRGSGTVDVDAIELRDAAADSVEPFLRDGPLVVELGCADVFDSGTESELYNAESTQGTWWATEQVESVIDYEGAVQFARGYLASRALAQLRPPAVALGLSALPRPGQLIAFRGADGAEVSASPLPLLRFSEDMTSGTLTTTLESGRELPSVESIVKDLQKRARRASTVASGGGSSSWGGGSSAAVGFGGTEITLPLPLSSGGTGGTDQATARTALGVDTESLQDMVASFLAAGTGITLTYNDAGGSLTIAASGTTDEAIQDMIASFLAAGSGISLTYNDAGNQLTIAASGGSANYQMIVPFLAPGSTILHSTSTASLTEILGATFRRTWADLTDFNTCRVCAVFDTGTSATGSLYIQYSDDGGSTWKAMTTLDAAGVSINGAGAKKSGWKSLVSGAKADVLLRPVIRIDSVSSGTVGLGLILLELRTSSSTSTSSDDGALSLEGGG